MKTSAKVYAILPLILGFTACSEDEPEPTPLDIHGDWQVVSEDPAEPRRYAHIEADSVYQFFQFVETSDCEEVYGVDEYPYGKLEGTAGGYELAGPDGEKMTVVDYRNDTITLVTSGRKIQWVKAGDTPAFIKSKQWDASQKGLLVDYAEAYFAYMKHRSGRMENRLDSTASIGEQSLISKRTDEILSLIENLYAKLMQESGNSSDIEETPCFTELNQLFKTQPVNAALLAESDQQVMLLEKQVERHVQRAREEHDIPSKVYLPVYIHAYPPADGATDSVRWYQFHFENASTSYAAKELLELGAALIRFEKNALTSPGEAIRVAE